MDISYFLSAHDRSDILSKFSHKFVVAYFKTESTRELSNFNFQCTKILYQENLKQIAFLFVFFNS